MSSQCFVCYYWQAVQIIIALIPPYQSVCTTLLLSSGPDVASLWSESVSCDIYGEAFREGLTGLNALRTKVMSPSRAVLPLLQFLLMLPVSASTQVEDVNPSFWWSGFRVSGSWKVAWPWWSAKNPLQSGHSTEAYIPYGIWHKTSQTVTC